MIKMRAPPYLSIIVVELFKFNLKCEEDLL